MPNWCNNSLTVSGPEETVAEFHAIVIRDGNCRLTNHWPTPQELVDTRAGGDPSDPEEKIAFKKQQQSNFDKYGARDWYDWNINNWGTKWSDSDTELQTDNVQGQLNYVYQTAWSPARGLIEKMSMDYPTLTFTGDYSEDGVGFMGAFEFIAGEMTKEITGDIGDGVITLSDGQIFTFPPYDEDSPLGDDQWEIMHQVQNTAFESMVMSL